MTDRVSGAEVVAQARDDSWWNREPLLVRGAIISGVTAVGGVLIVFGVLDTDQVTALGENAATIVLSFLVIVPIAQAAWSRLAAFAPRTAAKIAIVNTNAAFDAGVMGAPKPQPTIVPPP